MAFVGGDLHVVLPEGYDDPGRPSGGNRYGVRLVAGLIELGWAVTVHCRPVGAPTDLLDGVPDEALVLVDGLLAQAPDGLALGRRRLAILVHMADPPGLPARAVLAQADLVVATSAWTADQLTGRGVEAGRVVVASPGVDPAPLAMGTEPGGSLVCVAAVVAAKGHDVLIGALSRLGDRDWQCVLVGPRDREPDFVAQQRHSINQLGLTGRVTLTGALSGDQVAQAYANADLLVLPTRLEGYGMVVTEALARGLPVIASDVGGVPSALGLAGDGRRPGLLVPAGDATALAHALARWLDDAQVRAELRAAARDRRATLTGWDLTAREVGSALAAGAARER